MKFFVVYLVIFVISYLYGNGMVILGLDWFSAHVLFNYVSSTWPSAWNPCRRVMTNEVGLLCWQMHIRDQVTFILSKKIRVHLNLARFLQWKITLILARSRVPDKNFEHYSSILKSFAVSLLPGKQRTRSFCRSNNISLRIIYDDTRKIR